MFRQSAKAIVGLIIALILWGMNETLGHVFAEWLLPKLGFHPELIPWYLSKIYPTLIFIFGIYCSFGSSPWRVGEKWRKTAEDIVA